MPFAREGVIIRNSRDATGTRRAFDSVSPGKCPDSWVCRVGCLKLPSRTPPLLLVLALFWPLLNKSLPVGTEVKVSQASGLSSAYRRASHFPHRLRLCRTGDVAGHLSLDLKPFLTYRLGLAHQRD